MNNENNDALTVGTTLQMGNSQMKIVSIEEKTYPNDPKKYMVYITDKPVYRSRNIISVYRVNQWLTEGRISLVK
ncbi:hypothetical protein [Persicobacter psychrovividus]|uniref:Uncharacterized protein n=1 Tax=Persicobacter psychrovividus TaxID=387638 RepID=A0ABM7VLA5_9BACT|nr:hypothetical protein PEPS_39290 [Persicobacter psychrovividus]